MGVKLRMLWENVQGDNCRLDFDYADYNDEPQIIYGGTRPFVLSEYNSDDNIFKPVRPMVASIEVLASSAGVKMEDFITDNDNDIVVKFYLGSWNYWNGYLSQEDIEETWISTNHILSLTAYEGLGSLKNAKLVDENGENLTGQYSFYDLIHYAKSGSIGSLLGARFFCNLYDTSMSSAFNQMGLDQCKIDARTFENNPGDFDDRLTVLEKMMQAWSMTMFQWQGAWNFIRIPEYFTSSNLIGFINNALGRVFIDRRYDVEVGINKSVKPIMPEMLKRVSKPSKETTIKYDWDKFVQIVCNETFQNGTETENFVGGTGTQKFTVDKWVKEKGSISSPTVTTVAFERRVEYTNYKIDDDYIYIGPDVFIGDNDNWIRSCNVYVTTGDSVDIEFQYKSEQASGGKNALIVAVLLLYANDGTKYALSRINRTWVQWTTDNEISTLFFPDTKSPTDWVGFSQTFDDPTQTGNEPIPKPGYLNLLLYRDFSAIGLGGVFFKDLNFSIRSQAERNRRRPIKGNYDRYTIAKDVSKNYDETIFMDDAATNVYKGAIYESDGFTLTGSNWFRRSTYNGTNATNERLSFKRQNALAHWFTNRSYKTKIDANFFGLKWDAGGFDQPVGLINTIKFVDDAPTKIYWIANLREIDFLACTWSATLFEVFDTSVEDNEPTDQDLHTYDFYYE